MLQHLIPMIVLLLAVILTGVFAWYLEAREEEERLIRQSLEAAQLLDASLEEQLREMDAYRHDLAALLQDLDADRIRDAEE